MEEAFLIVSEIPAAIQLYHTLLMRIIVLYTGNLKVTEDNMEAVLSASTHLQVCEAVDLCCAFMKYTINVNNCVDLLHLSELYSLENASR